VIAPLRCRATWSVPADPVSGLPCRRHARTR